MTTNNDFQQLLDQIGALRETIFKQLAPQLVANPRLAETVSDQIDDLAQSYLDQKAAAVPPADGGLADLIGLGNDAPQDLSATRVVPEVQRYDETVASERINAMADLYYVYQHEKMVVFRALGKLEQLFNAGAVRLATGEGAQRLFGAETPWDTIEEILTRYFNESISTSPRQRMAVSAARCSSGWASRTCCSRAARSSKRCWWRSPSTPRSG